MSQRSPLLLSRLRLLSQSSSVQRHEAVIVAASRTPVGSINGSLKTLTAPQLGSIALKHAFEKSGVKPELVEEVYFGNVVQVGVAQSPARQATIGAGMPTRNHDQQGLRVWSQVHHARRPDHRNWLQVRRRGWYGKHEQRTVCPILLLSV